MSEKDTQKQDVTENVTEPAEKETEDREEGAEIHDLETETQEAPEESGDDFEAQCAALRSQVEELEADAAKLEEEKKTLYDQLLRSKADFDNFRRRNERERADLVKYANKELLVDFLAVRDNFDRAMMAIQDEKDPFVVGVKMIQKQFGDVFAQSGVEEIDPKGEPFNPHFHDALANEETNEFEENTVMEVFQKGFKYKGMLLRPAQVKVAMAAREEPIDTEA